MAVDDIDPLVVADDDVVEHHRIRRLIPDHDLGTGAGDELLGRKCGRNGHLIDGIGLHKNRSGSGVDRWQIDEEGVEFLLDQRNRLAPDLNRLKQSKVGERFFDDGKLHFVAGDRFDIQRVAGDPVENLLSLSDQQAAEVLVSHRRCRERDRLDDVELILQRRTERLRDIALIDGDLTATSLERGLCFRDRRLAGSPGVAITGNGCRCQLRPAIRVRKVLGFQSDQITASGRASILVEASDITTAANAVSFRIVHDLDDRARRNRESNVLQIEPSVLVPNVVRNRHAIGGEERRLLSGSQYAAE